jgi:hypothetical protein
MAIPDAPRAIISSPEEKRRGSYHASNLQTALEGLHQDGLLLLKGVVDVEHIEHLRSVMAAETKEILNNSTRAGVYNQG